MKVFLLKDCKDGKVNTLVNVSDQRGLFLISLGYAFSTKNPGKRPRNKSVTRKIRESILKEEQDSK